MDGAVSLVVLVVFVVAPGGEKDAMSVALERAARQTLGATADIVVERVDRSPTEAEAAARGAERHATAIAEVAWRDPEHRRAELHVRARESAPWIDREIGFAPSDAPAEQGRTIGFALASMLPEPATPPPSPASPPPPASSVPVAAPVVAGGAPGEARPTPTEQGPPPPPRVWRGGIEARGVAGLGVGGYGGGLGGEVGAEWYFARHLALRAEGSLRSSLVGVGSSRVDLQACKLEYSIVSPK